MADDKPETAGPATAAGSDSEAQMSNKRARTPPTIDLHASRSETSGADAAAGDDASGATDSAEPELPESPDATTAPPLASATARRPLSAIIAGAVAGAVVALLMGAAAWRMGALNNHTQLTTPTIATLETLSARVLRLENVTPAATTPAAPTDVPDAALSGRVETLEKTVAALRAELTANQSDDERLSKAVDDIKAAPAQPDTKTADSVANSAVTQNLAVIEERLSRLDAALQVVSNDSAQVKDAQAKVDQRVTALASDQAKTVSADTSAVRRAIVATALDLAVRQSEPFPSELEAARKDNGDGAALKPLDGFAANGVPGPAALCRELTALLAQADVAPPPSDQNLLGRLATNALRLVRFKHAGAVDGDDSSAIESRAASAAARNDLAAAQHEVMALPEADRARLQPWLDRVAQREAALAASRQFTSDAMVALSKPAP